MSRRPEFIRRLWARRAVRAAGLPMWRRTVDRARDLLDAHGDTRCAMDLAVDALKQEFRKPA